MREFRNENAWCRSPVSMPAFLSHTVGLPTSPNSHPEFTRKIKPPRIGALNSFGEKSFGEKRHNAGQQIPARRRTGLVFSGTLTWGFPAL